MGKVPRWFTEGFGEYVGKTGANADFSKGHLFPGCKKGLGLKLGGKYFDVGGLLKSRNKGVKFRF